MTQTTAHQVVRNHGRAAVSFQTLTAHLKYWSSADACIAYTEVGEAWVTVGGAIAAPERHQEATEQFLSEARRRGKRVRFFGVEGDTPELSSLASLHIGQQPVWDPQVWPTNLSKKLQAQLRRDRSKGLVQVRTASHDEIADPHSPTRLGIDAVISQWLDSRAIAPMGFMLQLNPYQLAQERRFFVAEHEGQVMAAAIAIPVYARNGWFVETTLRHPSAPNGTMELLFDHAMRTLAAEGSNYVTFGLCPLAGSDQAITRMIRRGARWFYNFEGLHRFKSKLGPSRWETVYLAYPRGDHPISALFDAGRAFLPGGILPFLWKTAIHRSGATSAVIGLMMLLCAIVAACTNSARWFPSREIQIGCAALDLLMVAGFATLARGSRRRLAPSLCALTVLDFIVSVARLSVYAGPRVSGLDWMLVAVPALALLPCACFLWSIRDRGRLYSPSAAQQPGRRIVRDFRLTRETEPFAPVQDEPAP